MNNPYRSSAQMLRDCFIDLDPDWQDPETRDQIIELAVHWLENIAKNSEMFELIAHAAYNDSWEFEQATPPEEARKRRHAIHGALTRAFGLTADPRPYQESETP
jgi:hypothetical protein